MTQEGATPEAESKDPKDSCPRINGTGKHYFIWEEPGSSNDVVVCINCGQKRRRTRESDDVIEQGVTTFPEWTDPKPPEAVIVPDNPDPIPPQTTVFHEEPAAPPSSYAGGGASGSWDSGSSDSSSSYSSDSSSSSSDSGSSGGGGD